MDCWEIELAIGTFVGCRRGIANIGITDWVNDLIKQRR